MNIIFAHVLQHPIVLINATLSLTPVNIDSESTNFSFHIILHQHIDTHRVVHGEIFYEDMTSPNVVNLFYSSVLTRARTQSSKYLQEKPPRSFMV